jgi:hypothetical protein
MDEGIMQALKLRYRRRQLQKIIMKMDTDKTLNGSVAICRTIRGTSSLSLSVLFSTFSW